MRIDVKSNFIKSHIISSMCDSTSLFKDNRFERSILMDGTYCSYDNKFEKVLNAFKFEDKESVETVSNNIDLIGFLNEILDVVSSFNYAFTANVKSSDLTIGDDHKILVRYSPIKFTYSTVYMTELSCTYYQERNRDLYRLLLKRLIKRDKKTRLSIILDEVF